MLYTHTPCTVQLQACKGNNAMHALPYSYTAAQCELRPPSQAFACQTSSPNLRRPNLNAWDPSKPNSPCMHGPEPNEREAEALQCIHACMPSGSLEAIRCTYSASCLISRSVRLMYRKGRRELMLTYRSSCSLSVFPCPSAECKCMSTGFGRWTTTYYTIQSNRPNRLLSTVCLPLDYII